MNFHYRVLMTCLLLMMSCNSDDSYVIGVDPENASVEFWTSSPTLGGAYIEIFFDDKSVGKIIGYSATEPECDDFEALTVTKSPGTYDWKGSGADGSTFTGTATFTANTCGKIEIKDPNAPVDDHPDGYVYTIRNVWQNTFYLSETNGSVVCGEVPTSDEATQWIMEAGDGANILLKNKATGTYLSIDDPNTLLSTATTSGSQWTLDVVVSGTYRIRNVSNPEDCINIEQGPVVAGPILDGWWSAEWYLEEL